MLFRFFFSFLYKYPPGSVLFDCLIIFFILYQLLLIIRSVCDATLLCIHFASYSFYPCRMKKHKQKSLSCMHYFCYICLFTPYYIYHHIGNITVSIECIIPLHAIIFSFNIIGLSFNDIIDSVFKPFPLPT